MELKLHLYSIYGSMRNRNLQFSISDAKAQILVSSPTLRFPISAASTQIFDARSSLLKPRSSISDLRC